jgi:multidrug resistance efflux pump
MSKMSHYVRTVKAYLTGDQDEKIALANEKTAKRMCKNQINAWEGKLDTLQGKVEALEEKLKESKYPTTRMDSENTNPYASLIVRAAENLDNAKQELKEAEDSLSFFKNLLAEYEQE